MIIEIKAFTVVDFPELFPPISMVIFPIGIFGIFSNFRNLLKLIAFTLFSYLLTIIFIQLSHKGSFTIGLFIHMFGATTTLSSWLLSQAPHHEKLLFAIILWWQSDISCISRKLFSPLFQSTKTISLSLPITSLKFSLHH